MSSMRPATLSAALLSCALCTGAWAQSTLSQMAKQQGCTTPPVLVSGTDLYKCQTESALSFFNVPDGTAGAAAPKRIGGPPGAKAPTPANFPRVDSATQRERDDVRKRVLTEELANEVKMMVESEAMMAKGSAPMPDETPTSPKYLDRMAKLRSTVDTHTKNVQALKQELDRVR
jgi:hypothetical protein